MTEDLFRDVFTCGKPGIDRIMRQLKKDPDSRKVIPDEIHELISDGEIETAKDMLSPDVDPA